MIGGTNMGKVKVTSILRRMFSIIMVSIFIIAMTPTDYIKAEEENPLGSKNNPYIVTNYSELRSGLNSKGYVKLDNDIVFEEYIKLDVDSSYRGGIDLNGHVLDFSGRYSSFSYAIRLETVSGDGLGKFEITDSNPDTTHGDAYVNSDNEALKGGIITGFYYNMNSMAGGVTSCIDASNIDVTVDGITFFKNSSGGGGTCICMGEDGTLKVNNCKFYDNKSNTWAPCIWYSYSGEEKDSKCFVTNCIFKGNNGRFSSALTTAASYALVENCLFEKNVSKSYGTLNVNYYGTLEVKDSVITGNKCESDELENTSTGGICIDVCGKLVLNGKVNVTGNTYNGEENNVIFQLTGIVLYPISLGDEFDAGSKVGLKVKNTADYDFKVIDNIGSYEDCFVCDHEDGELFVYNGMLYFKKKHVHTKGSYYERREPKCTVAGEVEHYICPGCSVALDSEGNVIENIIIPALGHDFSDNAKICKRDGCNVENPDYIAPTHVHSIGEKHEKTDATCEKTGTKEYYSCSGCDKMLDQNGDEITDITIPALGHDFSDNAKICKRDGCNVENPDYVAPSVSPERAPQTGDNNSWMLYAFIMILSLSACIMLERCKRREE